MRRRLRLAVLALVDALSELEAAVRQLEVDTLAESDTDETTGPSQFTDCD